MMAMIKYKDFAKYPVKNIPAKELFEMLSKRAVRVELVRRGWDIKSILRANLQLVAR